MRPSTLAVLVLAAVVAAVPAPSAAQHALTVGQAGPYDASVPTPQSVLDYELGQRFTPHHMIHRYAELLAEVSPRITLDTVARTFEGREVLLATVTSEANHARLEQIRQANARLADPRGLSDAELDRLVASTPSVAWLGYTVHGNEASGAEAALGVLYQLAAGQDEETRMLLDSVVVLIDPVQNPDGHERHVQDVMRDLGVYGPDPYPDAMVHGTPWPGGRTSHYLFDLNRDWFLHTHPETRGRMATWAAWHPHVAVDLHEMGSGSTYFFSPPMEPINPNVDPSIERWWQLYAEGNAAAFGPHGWGFFTREGYDEFYPGYGISWPVLTGAVGMTYEQASSDGGAIRRDDGSILTLLEAARHHYAASIATLRTTATRRAQRVRDYAQFRRTAIEVAEDAPLRTVVLEPEADGRAEALVDVLLRNGIEVGRLTDDVTVRATAYGENDARRVRLPRGAWVVDLAQPQGRLATAILEPDAALDSAFIREELASREVGEGDRFYDITAWSLPLTFGVDAWWTGDEVGPTAPLDPTAALSDPPLLGLGAGARGGIHTHTGFGVAGEPPFRPAPAAVAGVPLPDRATYAYAFAPQGESSIRMLAGLLADSARVRHAVNPFRVGAADFPAGAFLVVVNRNRPDIHDRVRELVNATGARVTAINNALVTEGTDLGSNSVEAIPVPRIALIGGEGVSAYSFGAAWYAFDQRLRLPVTRVAMEDLTDVLEDFNVIVLPSAYGGGLDEGDVDELRAWVRGGGTLVTLDGATAWAAQADLIRLEIREREAEAGSEDEVSEGDNDRLLPISVPGAIVRTVADTLSPLLTGIDAREIPVQLSGSTAFQVPDNVRPGEVVLRYADEDRLRIAGYLWPEAPAHIAGTPYLWSESVGSGQVIAFVGDPNFRGLWRGLLPVFANAVLIGGSL